MKFRNQPRNRVYDVGRRQRLLEKYLANQGFKADMRDMMFIHANKYIGRIGPYWVTRAIDPKGREVSLTGRFRMRECRRGPLLVIETSAREYEVVLPPKLSEQLF
jgi:hypothetical protein